MSNVDTRMDAADAVLDRLAVEVETPVLCADQAQGDLLVLRAEPGQVSEATEEIPAAGVPLVRGQGGHVHLLLGRVLWAPAERSWRGEPQTVGTVTVPEGEVGYLAHGDGTPASALSRDADHALIAFGPGTYQVRRQREQAEQVALVAD